MYRLILISTLTLYLLILSAQAGNFSATSIVLSTAEIGAIGKGYDAKVKTNVQSSAPQASASPTTAQNPAASKSDSKLKDWTISARPLCNATIDALTDYPTLNRIVLFVGVNSNGGYGVGAAEFLAENEYEVTLAVTPRYKSEVLTKEAEDREWEDQLQRVKRKYPSKITLKDFSKHPKSVAATAAIVAYRNQLMKDHKDILENKDIPFEDQVATVQGCKESSNAKDLKKDLDGILLAEMVAFETFLDELKLEKCVAIDCIVAAGYVNPAEIAKRYVIRYDSARAVSGYLNKRQKHFGVITGSYDALSNTTTEFGYYHVTKDAEMTVTLIPDSHIPNFQVFITYPRESVMALEGADTSKAGQVGGPTVAVPNVAYQYQDTKMYVTVYVDPDHPDVSVADCIANEKKMRKNNDAKQDSFDAATLVEFVKELKGAEDEYKRSGCVTGGFLHVNLPTSVAASVAYIAGLVKFTKYEDNNGVTRVTVVTFYMSFAKYADKFAQKSNRRHPQ